MWNLRCHRMLWILRCHLQVGYDELLIVWNSYPWHCKLNITVCVNAMMVIFLCILHLKNWFVTRYNRIRLQKTQTQMKTLRCQRMLWILRCHLQVGYDELLIVWNSYPWHCQLNPTYVCVIIVSIYLFLKLCWIH